MLELEEIDGVDIVYDHDGTDGSRRISFKVRSLPLLLPPLRTAKRWRLNLSCSPLGRLRTLPAGQGGPAGSYSWDTRRR